MKRLLFLILVFPFTQLWAQAPDPDFTEKMALSEGQNYMKSALFVESDDLAEYDLIYQKLDLTVDPAVRWIKGSVSSSVKFLKDNISKIRFDLTDSLTVDSVKFNLKKTTFTHSGNKISVNIPVPMGIRSVGQFEIFYHGIPPSTGNFGSFAVEKHKGTPVLWTLSEPYGAMEWWPCKQSLADKIDSMDVFVHCPSKYKAASNGKLVSDLVEGNIRTAHWMHRYPIATYLVAIAVTNYASFSDFLNLDSGEKLEVLNYVYPEYLETARTKSNDILSILEFYNSKFVQYPFSNEKYGHAQFGWGGGMEHQTMSFMHDLEYELVAHEMAHQWFGDYITLASWHDIWLNEGFATFLTGLVYENLQDGVWWPIWKNNLINKITKVSDGSVYVADTTKISRIFDSRLSYSKGAFLLHMLRWELGDQKFFSGMRDYLYDPTVAYCFASQEKFVKHMEAAGDTSLAEFFNDWYYGEGFPTYQLSYYNDFGDNGKVKLKIRQSQSHPSVSFFEMHVPVRVWKDGNYKDVRLHSTFQGEEFVISDSPVDSVIFDPQKWLCAKADQVMQVKEISKPEKFLIFSDLAAKKIRIVLPDFDGTETIRICDLSGRIVYQNKLAGADSRIDIPSLGNMVYLIEILSANKKKTVKILPAFGGSFP